MKWLFFVVAGLVGLASMVIVTGMLLPRKHVASRSARFRRSPDRIWKAITNYESFPSWRPNVVKVESLPSENGLASWRETAKDGQQIPYVVVESTFQQRLVTRIVDPKLPFGGMWTYELRPVEGGTELRITENGEVYNPFFRFMSRFVFGHASTIQQYLSALGDYVDETVTILK